MDNFFELLPFIIGIAYLLFGSRKKKQDQAKPVQKNTKTTKRRPSLEDILRELSGESVHNPIPEEPEPVQESYSDELKTADYHKEPLTTKIKTVKQVPKEVILTEENEDYNPDHEFDLRQAIINDAILNRPYQ